MDASMLAGGLVRRLQYLFGGLLFTFLMAQTVQAASVVVSVDHRVAVSYSKPQLDARKGSYSVRVRITNKSGAPLLPPLRLSFDKAALGGLAIVNAQGTGADGRPYFDIKLPKEMLVPKASTDPISIVVVAERGRAVARIKQKFPFKTLEAAQHVSAGVEVAPLEPRAEPYALKVDDGKVNVRFSVRVVGQAKSIKSVYLRRAGERNGVAMNDAGKDGDIVGKDGIYGATLLIDTGKIRPDRCFRFEAVVIAAQVETVSLPFDLCATALPRQIAESNIKNPLRFSDGSTAVADEILITLKPNTQTSAVTNAIRQIGAVVVGGVPSLRLFQLRLSSPVSRETMLSLVDKVRAMPGIETASVNGIGSYAMTPNDPQFSNQHGVKQVISHNAVTGANVWDSGAVGTGVTVVVLDSGLDIVNADINPTSTCQLASAPALVPCSDPDSYGHGTKVAGVIGAVSNNALGVTGVAYGSALHSIQTGLGGGVTVAQIAAVFDAAAAYVASHGNASVVNASFAYPVGFSVWTPVCQAIESLVWNSGVPRAIVAIAAGNNGSNGQFYPARCNTMAATLLHPAQLISVGNSVSQSTPDCRIGGSGGQNGVDTLCGGDSSRGIGGSNYGSWVDITAPGGSIWTTAPGANNFSSETGTSISTPFISGAAAILRSCGVPLDQIENTLRTSANVTVPFPDGSSAPRLDIYRAMMQRNHVPTGVSLTPNSVNENTPTPLEVGTLTAIDADTCDKHTFTIVPQPMDDSGSFNIVGNKLNFNAGVVLDREAKPGYTVTVHAVDFFGATSPDVTLTIDILNINEAPTVNVPATFTVTEDVAGNLVFGGTPFADVDSPTLTVTLSVADGTIAASSGGGVTVGGSATARTFSGTIASLNAYFNTAGNITYQGALNNTVARSLTVDVTDGSLGTTATSTINITPENDSPTLSVPATFTVIEDVAGNLVFGGTPFVDVDGSTLTVTLSVADGVITASSSGGVTVGGAATARTFSGTIASLNTYFNVAGNITYQGAQDNTAARTLTVDVSDGSSNTIASSTINITPVNDPPTLDSPGMSSYTDTAADDVFANAVGTLMGHDPDVGDTLTYGINGGTVVAGVSTRVGTYGTLAVNTSGGTYTFTPNNGAIQGLKTGMPASESFTVSVSDGVAPPVAATYIVNVAGADDPTSFSGNSSAMLSEDGTLTGGGTLVASDRDTGDAVITPQAGVVGAYGVFGIDGSGIWTYALNNSQSSVQALHAGQSVSDAFTAVTASGASQVITMTISGAYDVPTGVVGITGVRQLTPPQPPLQAVISAENNPDGWSISHYQWRRSDVPPPGDTPVAISGETNVTYSLVPGDVGKYMSVCATYADPASTEICSGTDSIAVGDPHITTVDGLHYDFQSVGEFVALRNSSGLEIQVRQTPVPTASPLTDSYSGLTSEVSVNSAVAARVGTHRVTYQADPNNNTASGAPVLRVDGVVRTLPAEGIDFGAEGRVSSLGSGIQIDFPDQTTLIVSSGQWVSNVWWMHLSVFHTSAYEGLMGARSKGSWLPMLSDGSALGGMPAALHDRYVDLYKTFADSWRVPEKKSLFDYAPGTTTATFTNKDWPTEKGPYVTGGAAVAKPLGKQVAELACRDMVGKHEKADCIFDVRVMGNKEIAKGHLLNQKIRLGAVNVVVRPVGKLNAQGEMVVIATVARHATVVPKVKGLRAVPAGAVQFMLGDKPLGKPVKLDAKGQAKLVVTRQNMERFNTGKLDISAQYQPVRDKANVFLPSISRKLTRELVRGR